LKQDWIKRGVIAKGNARQQWRARIETRLTWPPGNPANETPASNGGRGLKHCAVTPDATRHDETPASNGGRGLKPSGGYCRKAQDRKRPPAMAGAD